MEMNYSKTVSVDDMFEHQCPYHYKYQCGYYIIVDTMSYLCFIVHLIVTLEYVLLLYTCGLFIYRSRHNIVFDDMAVKLRPLTRYIRRDMAVCQCRQRTA